MTTLIHLLVAASALAADLPKVEECTLVTPMIRVGEQTAAAGAGFFVKDGERTLLVSSHQVVGPAGGLKTQVDAASLKGGFVRAVAHDAFAAKMECGRADHVLAIEAAPMGDTSATSDIAAFVVTEKTTVTDHANKGAGTRHPLTLADAMPAVGEPVYVVSKTAGDDHLLKGKVGQVTDGFLFYEFEGKPELVGSVGGPVLDASGKVVGIHVGMGSFEDGTLFGSANPLPAVKKALKAEAVAGADAK